MAPKSFSFNIEAKTFSMREVEDRVEITEKSRCFHAKARYSLDEVSILREELTMAVNGEIKLGMLRNRVVRGRVLKLQVRQNLKGVFLVVSIRLGFDGRASSFICIPKGKGCSGWSRFLEGLSKLPSSTSQGYVKANNNGIEIKVSGFNEDCESLRDSTVVVIADGELVDWSSAAEFVHCTFNLEGNLFFNRVAKTIAVFTMDSRMDVASLLHKSSTFLGKTRLQFFGWTPGVGTFKSDWVHPTLRWVQVRGVPFQLWNAEIMSQVVEPFGSLVSFEGGGVKGNSDFSINAQVSNCDLLKMPAFGVVKLDGVSFPISFNLLNGPISKVYVDAVSEDSLRTTHGSIAPQASRGGVDDDMGINEEEDCQDEWQRVSDTFDTEETKDEIDQADNQRAEPDECDPEDEFLRSTSSFEMWESNEIEDEAESNLNVTQVQALNQGLLTLGARLGMKGVSTGVSLPSMIEHLEHKVQRAMERPRRRTAGKKPHRYRDDTSHSEVI